MSEVDVTVPAMENVGGETVVGDEVREVPGSHIIKGQKVVVV